MTVRKPDDAPEGFDTAEVSGKSGTHTADWFGLLWATVAALVVFSPVIL